MASKAIKTPFTAEEIVALRKMLGMTQQEFADHIGASLDSVKHWELGRGNPNGTTQKLFEILRRDVRILKAELKRERSQPLPPMTENI